LGCVGAGGGRLSRGWNGGGLALLLRSGGALVGVAAGALDLKAKLNLESLAGVLLWLFGATGGLESVWSSTCKSFGGLNRLSSSTGGGSSCWEGVGDGWTEFGWL
jgi:hypothetical protein